MTAEQQLLYESRVRNRQVAIAVAAGVLMMAASIVGLVGPHAKVNELTLGLITDHKRGALDIVGAVLNALAEIAIAWTLVFLFRCARARSAQAQGFIPWLAIVGAALSVVAGVLNAFIIQIKVHEFVTTGLQTYDEANRLTSGSGLLMLQIASQLASLLVAIAFVLVSLQAMRVGLLPRFLGYVGMFSGALVLFPIIVVPIVQLYWLVSVGLIIAGIWPGGALPAWRSGQAEPWPSANEARARRVAQAEERNARRRGGRGARGAATADLEPAADGGADGQNSGADGQNGSSTPEGSATDAGEGTDARTRASTPKRKRKRRR